MSFGDTFKGLLDKAKGLLSSAPTPADRTDAVEHDRFEQRLFDELVDEAPALKNLIDDMHQTIDYAPDLVRDTVMQLWQGDPRVRPESQMAESHLINHAVANDLAESRALKSARQYTQHDKYGSAMAALGLSQEVREYVQTHETALKEQQEEAERAREEQNAALEGLEQAMRSAQEAADQAQQQDGQPGDDGQPGGEGDGSGDGSGDGDTSEGSPQPGGGPTPAQEQAQLTLEQAIAKAEAAQQAAEQASQKMRQQASQAQRDMRRPTEQALKQAAEELEDEAELFRTWGVDDGEVKQMDFKTRQNLAQSLRGSKMARYIKLIGRFKLMAAAQRVRKVEYGRDQVVGTELSGDLARVVPSELTALAMGDDEAAELLELDFYKRWFDNQLLSREFEGQEKVGKGAIIAVWDESQSMEEHDGRCLRCGSTNVQHYVYYDSDSGACQEPGCGGWASTREAWAKAFALALLDAAKQQNRDFVGIGFSSRGQQIVHRFPRGKGSQADVLAMVEHFFCGGTDFAQPMDMAVDILDQEFNDRGAMKGDIVFITDDACRVTPDWLSKYQKRKNDLDFRVFGVALGATQTRGALSAMSDNVRAIQQFADPSEVDDVFQVL